MKEISILLSLLLLTNIGKAEGDPVSYDLEKKLGVSGTWVWQEQDYQIDNFQITGFTLPPLPPGFLPPPLPPLGPNSIAAIENDVHSYTTRLDYWLFPFLNVYGILGHVEGGVDVTLNPPIAQTFNFDYHGVVYGAGAVAAIGWHDFFLSTDVSYTVTDLADGGSINTWVASPKLGIKKGRLTAWVGATYQATSHEQAGTFILPPAGIGIGYNAVLSDANNWNATTGVRWEFNDLWNLTVEGGFGDRHQALVSLGRRF